MGESILTHNLETWKRKKNCRDVIAGDYSRIAHYGWMAEAFAIASIVVYFGGLMCSHVAAFRIAANMRKTLMQEIR